MGRKAKFDGKTRPSGPRRKAKKQGEPTFPAGLLGTESQTLISIQIEFRILKI